MDKSPDAFRTISEVADWLGTPTHVLRFWESRFSQVKPVKRAGGRRYYRPTDMELLGGIKKLLHDDGLTIRGVQKILREEGVKHVAALSQPVDGSLGDAIEEAGFAQDVEPEAQTATIVQMPPPEAKPVAAEPETESPDADASPLAAEATPKTSTWADAIAAAQVSETQADVAGDQPTAEPGESPGAGDGDTETGITDGVAKPKVAETGESAPSPEAEISQPAALIPTAPESEATVANGQDAPETPAPAMAGTPAAKPATAEPRVAATPVEPQDEGPSLPEQVLATLRAAPSADPAKLKPIHERLTQLRAKMAQERPPASS